MATNNESSATSSTPVVVTPGNIISTQTPTIIAINASLMPIKLTSDNYAAWRAQFLNLLYGYDLVGYIDGSTPCPSQSGSISVSSASSSVLPTTILNPDYKLWKRQDSFILHGIIGSVSPSLSSLVSASLTSFDAWMKLQKTYANRSRTRMLGLRDKLIKSRKESLSIDAYMQIIKKTLDDLALIGHPLNDDEIVIHILNGLGSDYKELCAVI